MSTPDNTTQAHAHVSVYLTNGDFRKFDVESTSDKLIMDMAKLMSEGGFWSFRDVMGQWNIFNPASIVCTIISPVGDES